MTHRLWQNGGPKCTGQFDDDGAWKSTLTTRTTRFDQNGAQITGVEKSFDTKVFDGNVWGLEWVVPPDDGMGVFYMAPPREGELVDLDPALFVTPPKGMENGYVPVVTRQENAGGASGRVRYPSPVLSAARAVVDGHVGKMPLQPTDLLGVRGECRSELRQEPGLVEPSEVVNVHQLF